MATKFTPINKRQKSAVIRHVPSGSQAVSPDSPPMSPLSPPPSWFNDEDMECPHTPILKQSPPMSPFSPPPSWFDDEDMECPHSPIMMQSSSPLASLSKSLLVRLESNPIEPSSHSPFLVGQALAPSTLFFPYVSAPILQQDARPATQKRGSEELETAEVERGKKAARLEAHKTRKTQKTSTQDEETGLLTPVSNVSESAQSSTTRRTVRAGKPEM